MYREIIVIGGTGLVGSKVVAKLRESGFEAVAASPNSGVDTITGDGLAEALTGASVVVDVSNSPSFEDAAVLAFFETSTRNLTDGDTVRLAPVLIQPMAADDVATAVARVAVRAAVNGIIEVAGPERFRLDELVRRYLGARDDPRSVIADPRSRYFGAELADQTLVPGDRARLARTRFEDWLSRPTAGPYGALSSSPQRPPAGTVMAPTAEAAKT